MVGLSKKHANKCVSDGLFQKKRIRFAAQLFGRLEYLLTYLQSFEKNIKSANKLGFEIVPSKVVADDCCSRKYGTWIN